MYERILSLISIEWENWEINERISIYMYLKTNFISTLFTYLKKINNRKQRLELLHSLWVF